MPLFVIDFLKIKVSNNDLKNYLWSHPLLYFHSDSETLLLDKITIHTKKTRQYKGIIFEFTKYALYIHFKPHYFYNDDLHNANDFNVLNCIETLKEFIKTFQVDAKELIIINIEFGLNIIIPKELICVKDLLFLMEYHEQNEFHQHYRYPYCRYSTTTNKYGKANVYKVIKCYAKGVQFPQFTDLNTFRFEVKSNRKEYIKRLDINTLSDLLETKIYDTLSENIIKEFNEILIIDENAKPVLSKTKLKNHSKKLNPINWRKLLNKSKNVFRRNLKAYNDALDTCKTHLKKEVRTLIFDKLQELKKCADLTPFKDKTRTHFNNQCLLTGLNISMQKPNSKFLSHTGLRYYHKTNKKIYNEVKNKYLSKLWINSDYETQIKEIAHNIRNKHSNLKTSRKRKYNPMQTELF